MRRIWAILLAFVMSVALSVTPAHAGPHYGPECDIDNGKPPWVNKNVVVVEPKAHCDPLDTVLKMVVDIQRSDTKCNFRGLICKPKGNWTKIASRNHIDIGEINVRVAGTWKKGDHYYRAKIVVDATGFEGNDQITTYTKPARLRR